MQKFCQYVLASLMGVLVVCGYYQHQVNSLVDELATRQNQVVEYAEHNRELIVSIPPVRKSLDPAMVDSLFKQTVIVRSGKGHGSGVVLDAEKGIILTCNHCVVDQQDTEIIVHSGLRYKVKKAELYPEYDMAILYTEFPFIDADSAKVRESNVALGEQVIVLGSPLRGVCMTVGNLSAYFGKIEAELPILYYQTDAAINLGNSGGPWFDEEGYLIAISARKAVNKEAVAFGIPVTFLRQATEKLIAQDHDDAY